MPIFMGGDFCCSTARVSNLVHPSSPTIHSLRVRAVRVPMQHPHQTGGGAVAESPLVLTDLNTDDGVVGHSVVFTYTPAAL